MDDIERKLKEIEEKLSSPQLLSPEEQLALAKRYGELAKAKKSGTHPGKGNEVEELIMEIRAGTGGEEAALFAEDLFYMYQKFAEKNSWHYEIIDKSESSLKGIKSVALLIKGRNAYSFLKNESGVHRIQRIPVTEKSGRIHTSTASVAVLLEPKENEIVIRPQDIEISFFRSSAPGGQNVNKVETGVRILHKPSGLVVESQVSRTQQQNREHALRLLSARLLDREHQAVQKELSDERRKQIGSGERPEKIRTYNFPQDRITDHRLKKSWSNIKSVLEGNLEPIVEAFQK